jgi:hypothetical protein
VASRTLDEELVDEQGFDCRELDVLVGLNVDISASPQFLRVSKQVYTEGATILYMHRWKNGRIY